MHYLRPATERPWPLARHTLPIHINAPEGDHSAPHMVAVRQPNHTFRLQSSSVKSLTLETERDFRARGGMGCRAVGRWPWQQPDHVTFGLRRNFLRALCLSFPWSGDQPAHRVSSGRGRGHAIANEFAGTRPTRGLLRGGRARGACSDGRGLRAIAQIGPPAIERGHGGVPLVFPKWLQRDPQELLQPMNSLFSKFL